MYDFRHLNLKNPAEREYLIKEAVGELRKMQKKQKMDNIVLICSILYSIYTLILLVTMGSKDEPIQFVLGCAAIVGICLFTKISRKKKIDDFEKTLKNFITPAEAKAYGIK